MRSTSRLSNQHWYSAWPLNQAYVAFQFFLPLVVNYLGLMHAGQYFLWKKMHSISILLSFPWKLLYASKCKGIYIKKTNCSDMLFLYWLLQRMILYFFLQITYSKNCLALVHLKTENQMGNLRHSYLNVILPLGYLCYLTIGSRDLFGSLVQATLLC